MSVLRFHLLTITHEQVNGSVIVTITTNAACHLYLRYSDIFPRIHRKSVARRGLVMGWDARYCFVAYQHIEQNEPGDEWTHTFTWPGWENCHTRYFYFWGTMGGQDMVSDTPIFWIHYLAAEVPPFEYFYSDPHPELVTVDGFCGGYANDPLRTWQHMHDASGDEFGDLAFELITQVTAGRNANQWDIIRRSLLLFDTSAIGPGKTILAAELRTKCKGTLTTAVGWAPYLVVVSSLPFQNASLRNADYSTLGTVALSDALPWADFTVDATNTFTLNPDGLLAIDPEGITKLGIREHAYDRADSAPPWGRRYSARVDLYSAENLLEPDKPRLGVAYT